MDDSKHRSEHLNRRKNGKVKAPDSLRKLWEINDNIGSYQLVLAGRATEQILKLSY